MNFAYNQADSYVIGKVDDYFDLNRLQKRTLEKHGAEILAWHKKYEIPRYSALLREISEVSKKPIDQSTYRLYYKKVEDRRNVLMRKIIPVAVELMLSLSEEQIQYFSEQLDENLEELKEDVELSREKRIEKRTEKILDNIEEYSGDWQGEKRKRLIAESRKIPDTLPPFYRHRLNRKKEILSLLRAKDKNELTKKMTTWLTNPRKGYDATYLRHFDEMVQSWEDFTLWVSANADNNHRDYFRKKLNELAARVDGLKN